MIARKQDRLELRCDGRVNGSACGRWLASVVVEDGCAMLKVGKCRCGGYLTVDLLELLAEVEKLRRQEKEDRPRISGRQAFARR
jgi:hypothetical protein